MNDTLDCGHLTNCMNGDGNCKWCEEVRVVEEEKLQLLLVAGQAKKDLEARDETIEDLERDNKALRDQLSKKAVMLQPGDHRNFDAREIGYMVMLPGAIMYTPDGRMTHRIAPASNAETPAKSEPSA